mmetsp:Transcript_2712/g.7553  ORF Transcript_2712/g.7553 Transcript_2712/m.7553 type:complete len:497 (-) Transcript_2712:265-1755(-)
MSGHNRTVDDDNDSFYDAESYSTPQSLTVDPNGQLPEGGFNGPKLSPYAPMPLQTPPKAPASISFEEQNNPETSLPPASGGFGVPPPDHRKSYNHHDNAGFFSPQQPPQILSQQYVNQDSYKSQSIPIIPSMPNEPLGDMLAPPSVQNLQIPPPPLSADAQSITSSSSMHLDTVDLGSKAVSYQNMSRSASREQYQSSIPGQDSLSYQFPYRQHGSEGGSAFTINYENEQSLTLNEEGAPARVLGNRGDSTLRPNTGLTNSYDYSLWGMAPHELLKFLQRMNMLASAGCVVVASLSWLGQLIFLQLEQVVLLAYLAFFSFVLGLIDLMALITPEQQRLIPTNMLGRIRDQLGFMFHPWGKALFVLLLTTMCWGIGGIFLSIAGTVYFISSLGWFYAAVAYRDDIPRLMGSIDETYVAESRRRNVSRPRSFSVGSWEAIMRDQVAAVAARRTWASWTNTSRTPANDVEAGGETHTNGDGGDDNEPGERASLIGGDHR